MAVSRPGCALLAGAPMLVAHRGGALLAPENTLEAFTNGVRRWGADMIELDLRLTADGSLVVFHDPDVDRTTDGSGPLSELTLRDLKSLDAAHHFVDLDGERSYQGTGVTVPTFDEVLEAFPDIWITAELKEAAAAGPAVETIRARGAEHRVLIAAAEESWRDGARPYGGPLGATKKQIRPFVLLHRLPGGGPYSPGIDVFQVPERWGRLPVVTPRFVQEAHRRNIPVQVWTVDDEAAMRRLLEMGVDGIQTDRPDTLARVLTEVAGRPPAPCLREVAA